jgi:hypothetical protein
MRGKARPRTDGALLVDLGEPIDLQRIGSRNKVFQVMELDEHESADLLPHIETIDQSKIIDFPK